MSLCNATALRKASRRISSFYDNALAPSGLKTTQYAILAELNRRSAKPPTMSELAHAMAMDRSTLGHNLRPLERETLVAFARPSDLRVRRVILTALGLERFTGATPHWRRAQLKFESSFTAEGAASLRATLGTITSLDFTDLAH